MSSTFPSSTLPPRSLTANALPRWAPLLVAVVSAGLGVLASVLFSWGVAGLVLVAGSAMLLLLPLWSAVVENGRKAKDRLMTGLVWSTLAVALLPLVSLLWKVISKGAPQINGDFLTYTMRNVILAQQGGIYHALIGTLLVTVMAGIISIPIGIFCAIYLIEYGAGSRLAQAITFLVDVMTGIPSIVAGLFAYALLVALLGPGTQMAFGGAIALSLLMIPVVVRSTEEMLKLVPNDLREAAYALGVPKWRTIAKVVLPTALSGIITGVTLAIARVIGETAPLVIICGMTDGVNTNPFSQAMATLPVFIYSTFQEGTGTSVSAIANADRAWGAALVLIVIVMALNLLARFIGKIFAPKTGR
ncbi:phosphate ABC transporter permease PstA [Nocardioides jejuensis]|uniref:Phosphate transport system permease protein PstA n=1 Tax=Nocardioides jejuensis TaxID=2502782 RepID=A0A4V2NZS9_9ACTN|nr:phosphate ABC transporter permease PstA [Nocardioides jejuensis]TCJ30152.1 phosphate ABC transporter permease PstA [Nocardioides jejuensis]